jgi:hypothetical protein
MGCAVVNEEVKDGRSERFPAQPMLGLVLGAVAGVAYPGLIDVPFLPWIIPALIALVLQISPRTRSLAVGFGAASVGWLAFLMAFGLVPVFAPLLH